MKIKIKIDHIVYVDECNHCPFEIKGECMLNLENKPTIAQGIPDWCKLNEHEIIVRKS